MGGYFLGNRGNVMDSTKQASSHYGVSLTGAVDQYVRIQNMAYANGILEAGQTWHRHVGYVGVNPNNLTVSIETEDRVNIHEPVTAAMFDAVYGVCRHIMDEVAATWDGATITHLVGHRVISPINRPNCPGPRWIDSGKFAQLAAKLGLTAVAQ
jgi:N-acetylmuramoyl-L-alanine amidase